MVPEPPMAESPSALNSGYSVGGTLEGKPIFCGHPWLKLDCWKGKYCRVPEKRSSFSNEGEKV